MRSFGPFRGLRRLSDVSRIVAIRQEFANCGAPVGKILFEPGGVSKSPGCAGLAASSLGVNFNNRTSLAFSERNRATCARKASNSSTSEAGDVVSLVGTPYDGTHTDMARSVPTVNVPTRIRAHEGSSR